MSTSFDVLGLLDRSSPGVLAFLLDATVKGAVVLAVAWLAILLMKRSPAAARHFVWLLAILSLLILPVLSACLPAWRVLPQWAAVLPIDQPTVEPVGSQAALPPAADPDHPPRSLTPLGATDSNFSPTSVTLSPTTASPVAPATDDSATTMPAWALLVWLIGTVIAGLPLVWGPLVLRRLGRTARPMNEPRCHDLLADLARDLGVNRHVELLQSDGRSMPMTWGIWRPKILLPGDFHQWSADRCRTVLLHELAHVRRWDCLWQLLIHLACAAYWFNPLVWVARTKAQDEQERACDDVVLSCGASGTDYAEQLLHVASAHRAARLTGVAIAMARPSQLEGRLLAILDDKRNRRSITRFSATALTLLLTAAVVAVAVVRAGSDAAAPLAATHTGTSDEVIRVRGKVVDPDGRPVANARVSVPSTTSWETRLFRKPVARVTSDANGRFDIAFRKSDVSPFIMGGGLPGADPWEQTQLVASADGYGLAFDSWRHTDAAGDVVLQFRKDDVPIDGRVLDQQGRPVSGVKVAVEMILPLLDDAELEAAARKAQNPPGDLMLAVPLLAAGEDRPIVSGADGRFRIAGIGRDRRVTMYLSHEKIGFTRLEAATRLMDPITRVVDQPIGTSDKFVTYGARFEYTAVPGRTVQGVITDAATKQPMAGVVVKSLRFAGPFQGYDPSGMIRTVTDQQGRYQVHGFPKGKGNKIIVQPTDEQSYFQREAEVPDEPGPVSVDLELHKGVWITGKVLDKVTGQPQPARVSYTTYLDNPHTHALPEFRRRDGAGFLDGEHSRWETKPDGSYRLLAAPGKAIVSAWCLAPGYVTGVGFDEIAIFQEKDYVFRLYQRNPARNITHVVREVDVPPGAASVTCDLLLDPGDTIKVTIVGTDGKPAAGPFLVRGNVPESYGGWYGKRVEKPAFDAVGFTRGSERTLFVLDDERRLGRAVPVKLDEVKDGNVTVQLQPLAEVTGRLVTTAGDVLTGVSMEARESGRGGRTVRSIETDAQGRFSTTLPPGVKYYIMVDRGKYVGEFVAKDIVPQPGGKTHLDDVKINAAMQ